MADPRFFTNCGPFTLNELVQKVGAALPANADGTRPVRDVASLETATAEHLSFLDNPKYTDAFEASNAGACFVKAKFAARAPLGMIAIICDDPYRAYAYTAAMFYPTAQSAEISTRATISDSAQIGQHVSIAAGAVIGDGVIIGDHTRIGANTVISHAIIGARCIIHPNVNIGQDGFGFAMSAKGHLKVPQLGRVVVGDDVEIGAGTCIDRGAGPDTTIGDGTKIDNLVQIAHNVQIGRGAIIVSQVGISGSTQIGDFAVLGGQVGVAGHLSIGQGVQIAAQSGVIQPIEAGKTYGGSPAVPIKDWHRQSIALKKLVNEKRVKTEPLSD
jgi:UDP-3-O-[3-hydroxymyristoyl] glucosamine N-acyltransferase